MVCQEIELSGSRTFHGPSESFMFSRGVLRQAAWWILKTLVVKQPSADFSVHVNCYYFLMIIFLNKRL